MRLDWFDMSVWKRAGYNTAWCLLGCAIGDFGTIAVFQFTPLSAPVLVVFSLAIVNGILTSIALETIILSRQMQLRDAFRTAIGMSLISMVSMEIAMNAVDYFITGGAKLSLVALPFMLAAGFVTPLPYNYWRLKALGKSCH